MAIANPTAATPVVAATSGTTIASASFTPFGGACLVVPVSFSCANSPTFSIADTFGAGLTWTRVASTPIKGTTATFNGSVLFVSSPVPNGTGAGVITVTSTQAITNAIAEWFSVTGTSGLGTTGNANGTTSPTTVALGTAPAASSMLFGTYGTRVTSTPTIAGPTGYTALTRQLSGTTYEQSFYKPSAGAQSNAFTSTQVNSESACVVELVALSGPYASQATSVATQNTVTTQAVSLAGVLASSVLLFQYVGSQALTGVAGGGATWSKVAGASVNFGTLNIETWVGVKPTGGATTVTATLAASGTAGSFLLEASNVDPNNPVQTAGATLTTGTVNYFGPAITPTDAPTLVVNGINAVFSNGPTNPWSQNVSAISFVPAGGLAWQRTSTPGSSVAGAQWVLTGGSSTAYASVGIAFEPTAQARPLAEGAATADALTIHQIFGRPIAEGAAAADAVTSRLSAPRVLGEGAATLDSVSDREAELRPIAEGAATSDALARALVERRSLAEGAATVDSLARLAVLARSLAEACAAADSVSGAGGDSRALAEGATTTDSLARAESQARALAELAASLDALASSGAQARALADPSTTSDDLSGGASLSAALADASATADALSRATAADRSIEDLAATADVLAGALRLAARLAEGGLSDDSLSTAGGGGDSISESNLAGDALRSADPSLRSLSEANAALDSLAANRRLPRALAESCLAADVVTGGAPPPRPSSGKLAFGTAATVWRFGSSVPAVRFGTCVPPAGIISPARAV